MRSSSCLLLAAWLSSGVNAFYPYRIDLDLAEPQTLLNSVARRFFPWSIPERLLESPSPSTSDVPTLELKKVPRRVVSAHPSRLPAALPR